MSDYKKHLLKLMEEVDMNYQAPVEPNSGNGLTKFAPTPASKVLKNYTVDGDFLRKAIGYGGVPQQAVDQIMGAIDGHGGDMLGGSVFDTVINTFTQPAMPSEPSAPATPVGDVPPVDTPVDTVNGTPVAAPAAPDTPAADPVAPLAPVDAPISSDVPPVTAPPGEGIPQDDGDAAINAANGEPVSPPEEEQEEEPVSTLSETFHVRLTGSDRNVGTFEDLKAAVQSLRVHGSDAHRYYIHDENGNVYDSRGKLV
jgi:hypothetical protein